MRKWRCTDLERRAIELAIAKLPESVVDLPFEDSLAALEEVVELPSNADLGAAILEQPLVQSFLQVLTRPSRHAPAATQQLKRHFRPL